LSPERPALRLIPLLAAALLLAGCAAAAASGPLLLAVGDVDAGAAVLWVRGAREGEVAVEYGPAAGGTTGTARLRVSERDGLVARARLTGLVPGTRYVYRVRGPGAPAGGEFATAPAPKASVPVRFVWSGDLGGGRFCRRVDAGYRIFHAMRDRRPDFFLFVGDTIYADHRCTGPDVVPGADFVAFTLAQYRARHAYNREDPAFRAFLARTPVYAIWDDHEVRNDFAGPDEPLMETGRRAFLDYWPIVPPADDPGRLYRSFRWGRLLELFILDTRQYRSPNHEPDGPGKTMLGPAQRRWLLEGLAASPAVWKVVVSSVPLSVPTGRAHRDSWSSASVWGLPEPGAGFAHERDAILREAHERGVRNLVVLAADVHHAEVIRHQPFPGFTFHEMIAGPLSATPGRPRPLDASLNPRSLFARGGMNNFGEVSVDPAGLTVRILDEAGTVLFTHTIPPDQG
jgi:alkaline phosphatase D